MPERPTENQRQPPRQGRDRPRTDLPPRKRPYDGDYFGTGEEEGVERERQAGDDEDE